MLVIVINCLRLFVVVIYCCHGDGSDVCVQSITTIHTIIRMLVIAINCLRLFVDVIYCYHGNGVLLSATYRLLFWKRCFIA